MSCPQAEQGTALSAPRGITDKTHNERMITVPSIRRIAACAVSAFMAAAMLCTGVAYADEPYDGYNYDWYGDPIPSQNGYVVEKVVTGKDIGCGDLSTPSDMFVSASDEIYIADTAYSGTLDSNMKGRIIKTDSKFNLINAIEYLDFSEVGEWLKRREDAVNAGTLDQSRYAKETSLYFKGPTGVFVDDDDMIYVADNENERVVAFYAEKDDSGIGYGKVVAVYTRPEEEVFDQTQTFNPSKVLVDAAKNVYIVIDSTTKGAIVFSREGEFNGYFGANRVEKTGEVIMKAFWKLIFTREQIMRMRRNVPVEISNFDIDEDNFIYTVTETKNSDTDILKKLNSAGTNIFVNLGYDDYNFGDYLTKYYRGKTYSSRITDVDIGDNGVINLLDLETGRIFQYSDECDLLFIFGGTGSQKGTFTTVNAVESLGNNVFVLDGRKNSVTVFGRTEFGSIVHEAITLFNTGKYAESVGPWNEVLRRDSNYWWAYVGLGNAYLNQNDFETAMDYFYYNSRMGYNEAFKGWRMAFIRENFTLFAVIIILLLAAIYVISSVRGRQRAKKKAAADKLLREQQKKEE